MVRRSPTSSYYSRLCNHNISFPTANMAPIKPGRVTKADKARAQSTRTPKPVQKKKVRCTKCTDLHPPPSGRNCNRQPPRENLTSTFSTDPEQQPEVEEAEQVPPTMSPIRTDGVPTNPLDGNLHAASGNMPTLQQRMDAANRISRAFTGYNPPTNIQNLAPPPYVLPSAQVSPAPAAAYGPAPTGPSVQDQLVAASRLIQQLQAAASTGQNNNGQNNNGIENNNGIGNGISGPSGLELPPPLNPTPQPPAPTPTRNEVIDKCLKRIMDTVADLNDRECERTERENNMRQNTSNNNVSSPRVQDEENQVANMSHVSDNFTQRVQHRRAGEAAPPRPTGQYHNPDQMVTDRLAGLGEQAAARRNGGQGVYGGPYCGSSQQCPPDLTQYNHYNADNQYHEPQFRRGPTAGPARCISSGRDRTGSDGTTRIYIPWPNEHCLIGIERRKVKYDQLNQAQWHAGLMNILEMQRDPLIKQNMSAHVARLSQDVVDCGFAVAKGAHAAVLIAIEDGRANWAEPHVIESIRRDSVSRVYLEAAASARESFTSVSFGGARPRSTGSSDGRDISGPQRNKANKTHAVCKHYNNNTCNQTSDHTVGNITYNHVCSFCRANGKSYPHPEAACQKKSERGNS